MELIINLSYYHVADDVPETDSDIAVVIDVLRATTTAISESVSGTSSATW